MILKAPFPWFGGKSRAAELAWSRLGDVGNYIEPFSGSLAVLLARPHQPRIETVNDRDCYLSNFWRSVQREPEKVAHYADWPVNECDLHARHKWLTGRQKFRERMLEDPGYHDAKIAGWWCWGISQWIGAGWCSRPKWMGRRQGGRSPRGLNTLDARHPHLSSSMGIHAKRPVINRGARGINNVGAGNSRGGTDSKIRPHLSTSNGGVHSPILDWMNALAERLRRVRVCCGDWSRVVTPSCTWKLGGGQLTGVLLDPPYSHDLRDSRLYSIEQDVSAEVRAWAFKAGSNPKLRIALCGLEGEHDLPGWDPVQWRAPRGYSKKKRVEIIWFSPYCLPSQPRLFEQSEMLQEARIS